jgi:uncharacterized membrane protein
MNNIFILILLCLLSFTFAFSHEAHKEMNENKSINESVQKTEDTSLAKQYEGRPHSWMQWVGSFHFIFLHFPIALIAMTVISELLFAWYASPIFDYASRFMLIAAAILAVPTALLGLTYSYTATYDGILADFVWWHMWFGFAAAIFAIFVAFIRERWGISKLYYTYLVLLFFLVNITGFLGGGMTFGPYHMLPPSFFNQI